MFESISRRAIAVTVALFMVPLLIGQAYTFNLAQAQESWDTLASMDTARQGTHAAVVGGQLYVIGGNTGASGVTGANEVYNPNSNSWSTKASMTDPAYDGAIGVIGSKIYIAGGWNWPTSGLPQTSLKIYDTGSNSWSSGANMPIRSGCSVGGVMGGEFYVLTGCDGGGGYRQRLHAYNTSTDSWTEKASANNGHADGDGAVINGKFYVLGGMDSNGTPQSKLDVYNPSTDSWSSLASMGEVRNSPAVTTADDLLYAMGGFWAEGEYISTAGAYDPASDSWDWIPDMPQTRRQFAAGSIDGKVYAVGGHNGSYLSGLIVYDPYSHDDSGEGEGEFEPSPELLAYSEDLQIDMEDFAEEVDQATLDGYDTIEALNIFTEIITYLETEPEPTNETEGWAGINDLFDIMERAWDELDYVLDNGVYIDVEPDFPTTEMEEAIIELGEALVLLGTAMDKAGSLGWDLTSLDDDTIELGELTIELSDPTSEQSFWNDLDDAWEMLDDLEVDFHNIVGQDLQPPSDPGDPVDPGDIAEMRKALYEVDEEMRKVSLMLEWFGSMGVDLDPLEDIFLEVARHFVLTENYLNEDNADGFYTSLAGLHQYIEEDFYTAMEEVLLDSEIGEFFELLGEELQAIDEEVSYLNDVGERVPSTYDEIIELTEELGAAFDDEDFSHVTDMIDELVYLMDDFWNSVGEDDHDISFEPPAGYEDEVITLYQDNPFPDTSDSSLEGKAAADLYRRAVIGGFPDGQFKGDRPVNRAEAAKFLLLAADINVLDLSNQGKFSDVVDDQWYTPFVMTCSKEGIIGGYPDGSFKPASTVNTVEFLKMLNLAFGAPTHLPFSYSDVPSNAWFASYAGIAEKYDLFPNRSRLLYPARELTRNEVAVAIYQYLQNR